MKITCSTGFLLLAASLIYLDGTGLFFASLAACVLHEAGHYAAVILCGGRVRSLRITAVGAEMEVETNAPLSYRRDILVALAGPCVNLFVAMIAVRTNSYLFAGLNICLGVLNLFPVYPLDGGKVLTSLLSFQWPSGAEKVVHIFSIVFSGALLGLGWAAWRGWGNLSLLCTAAWITAGTIRINY